jgi:hypothetical protein
MKITERTPVYDYHIPKNIADILKESKVVCVELLDEMLNKALGFHFLEPVVSFEDVPKIKPVIINSVKPSNSQAEAVTLMNKAEKK